MKFIIVLVALCALAVSADEQAETTKFINENHGAEGYRYR